MKTKILYEILHLTQRIGPIRVFFIGMIFPEFPMMLGKLSDLSKIVCQEEGTR